jgi:hypothetical protein
VEAWHAVAGPVNDGVGAEFTFTAIFEDEPFPAHPTPYTDIFPEKEGFGKLTVMLLVFEPAIMKAPKGTVQL